jgi:hypothetical protein
MVRVLTVYTYDGVGYYDGAMKAQEDNLPVSSTSIRPPTTSLGYVAKWDGSAWQIVVAPAYINNPEVDAYYLPLLQKLELQAVYAWLNDGTKAFSDYKAAFKTLYAEYLSKLK